MKTVTNKKLNKNSFLLHCNSLPINNRGNISQNNIIEVEHDVTSINSDFHTRNNGNTATRILTQEKSQNLIKQLV